LTISMARSTPAQNPLGFANKTLVFIEIYFEEIF